MEIEDLCAFLQSFTHVPSVVRRIPQNRQWKMTFANFTQALVEPYILEEVTRQMQDAQSHFLNLAEEHQHLFETELVENANRWMEYLRKNFCLLATSDQMIRKRVEVLEQATAYGYSIDAENDMLMNAAPALPLAIAPPPHYAAEVAPCMINEKYQPWLNELGRQFMPSKSSLQNCKSRWPKYMNVEPLLKWPSVRLSDHGEQLLRSKTSGRRHVLSGLPNLPPFHRGDHRDRTLLSRHLRRLSPQHLPLYHDGRLYLPLRQWNKIRRRYVSNENNPLR